jgi:hypothetical protein
MMQDNDILMAQFAAKACESLMRGANGQQLDMYRFNSVMKTFRSLIADACYGAGRCIHAYASIACVSSCVCAQVEVCACM